MDAYHLEVSNTPDGDGHYRAAIYQGAKFLGVRYSADRAEAVAQAKAFVERHKQHDLYDYERIDL